MKNTTLCYIEKDDAYLMMHRVKKKNDINAHKWIGVGGHFEEGESPEDCVLREVYEETGLTLGDLKFRGIITFVTDKQDTEYMHLFTSDSFTGTICECDEGILEWVKKDDVYKLPVWEGDLVFFKLLETKREFFSLKLVYDGEKLKSAVLDGKNIEDPLNCLSCP